MRLPLAALLFLSAFLSCSSPKRIGIAETVAVSGDEKMRGEALIRQSDCVTCHKNDEQLIGPSFLQIADKYKLTGESIDRLAEKIIKGGGGSWGDVYMTPHPGFKEADARLVVKYLLTLKK